MPGYVAGQPYSAEIVSSGFDLCENTGGGADQCVLNQCTVDGATIYTSGNEGISIPPLSVSENTWVGIGSTISVRMDTTDIKFLDGEHVLYMGRWDELQAVWERLPATLDGNTGIVTTEDNRFGLYAPIIAYDKNSCASGFSATPNSGTVSLAVQFTDRSTGEPTYWLWDFGDGGTSNLQNPVHTYTRHGTYSVSLTVWNKTNVSTRTVTDMIQARKYIPQPNYDIHLRQAPNPFNPTTVISFKLAAPGYIKLEIFDLRGRKVATLVDEDLDVGVHEVTFDGRALGSGVYFYRLTDAVGVQTQKMTLLK